MAVDRTLQGTVGPNGETFQESLAGVVGQSQPLRSRMGQGGTFGDESAATRALITENVQRRQGRAGEADSRAEQQFRSGPRSGSPAFNRASGTSDTSGQASGAGSTDDMLAGERRGAQGQVVRDPVTGDVIPNFIGTEEQREAGATVNPTTGALTSPGDGSLEGVQGGGDITSRVNFDELPSQEDLITRETDRIQSQIDRINRQYDARIQEAQRVGRGRLGESRSLQSIGGTRFSPTGTAQTEQVRDANQDVIDEIERERQAAIASTVDQARSFGAERFQEQQQAAVNRANSIVNAISEERNLDLREEEAVRNAAFRKAALTGAFQGNPTMAMREYLTEAEQQAERIQIEKDRLQQQIDQANKKNLQPIQMPDGSLIAFDPKTGDYQNLGNFAEATVQAYGGGSVSRASDIVPRDENGNIQASDFQLQLANDLISERQDVIARNRALRESEDFDPNDIAPLPTPTTFLDDRTDVTEEDITVVGSLLDEFDNPQTTGGDEQTGGAAEQGGDEQTGGAAEQGGGEVNRPQFGPFRSELPLSQRAGEATGNALRAGGRFTADFYQGLLTAPGRIGSGIATGVEQFGEGFTRGIQN